MSPLTPRPRVALGCLVVLFASGCAQEQAYVGPEAFYSFALTESTPALVATDEAALFIVETRVELPVTIPTGDEMAELQGVALEPYGRLPWVVLGDLPVEIDLAVTNLMPERRNVTITINGFSEFHEYVPGFTIVDDEVIPNYNQWERLVELEANQTWYWTVQEAELDEAAIDLATIGNGAPNPNQIVYFENQSDHDERAQPYIPEIIAGLTGFRVGIAADAASNIVVEASVRVRDENDRLADPEVPEEWWPLPTPTIFMGTAAVAP